MTSRPQFSAKLSLPLHRLILGASAAGLLLALPGLATNAVAQRAQQPATTTAKTA